jgi:ComF family protein
MLDKALSIIAPHHCYSCGVSGALLCVDCKNNIKDDVFFNCMSCGVGGFIKNGVCSSCKNIISRAWVVGVRDGELKELINDYKFSNLYAAHETLADVLAELLPHLPESVVLVPIPTIRRHIRQRGYDHIDLLVRRVSSLTGAEVSKSLVRANNAVQLGAGKRQREAQAKIAFKPGGELNTDKIYLLVDDVVTTGATMRNAAKVLREAGATEVWAAAIVRQPLD